MGHSYSGIQVGQARRGIGDKPQGLVAMHY
jgi:hypothetical protein